ncbi:MULTISPECIES: cysteine desulfurase family protein [unclassified Luteococcus]|uniref:cysteine desulfurase family protein n=1 Tax=unclassified Luteococcus TaxID=2639923 RepID=UPI00313ACD1C
MEQPQGQTVRRSYLDHAASSPMLPAAMEALLRHGRLTGNPAALHTSGRAARAVLEDAREQLAEAVGAHPTEVIFTSGGSEADSIALNAGARRPGRRGVLIGATEHHSVADARVRLPGVGALSCDRDGLLDPAELSDRLGGESALVSVMSVNNETGTIQPLDQVVEQARRVGAWVHTDAVQALGHVPVDFAASGVDLMSLSGHKIGAPVGIGALLARRDLELPPWGLGGGQERDVRSGTQPVMLAAAFAAAAAHAVQNLAAESARLRLLRDRLTERVRATITRSFLNGAPEASPHIANFTFEGTRADDVLMLLDQAGIDCSTGAACRAGVHQPSEVLLAMGRTPEQAQASIRFSFGASTVTDDVANLISLLPDVISLARAAHSVGEVPS